MSCAFALTAHSPFGFRSRRRQLPQPAALTHYGRYSLRVDEAYPASRKIVGEILLTTRRFYSSASVCPDRLVFSESDSDDDQNPLGTIDHGTMPMVPIDEPALAAVAVAHGSH